ncbi:MAG: membrane dipeptidase [Acidobacteria bacterium]|nr:membrane dipeptidase [Acidobacteriota bacterium]
MCRWIGILSLFGACSTFYLVGSCLAVGPAASGEVGGETPEGLDPALWKRAVKLTREALVADTHCDTAFHFDRPGYRFDQRHDEGHVDLPRMRQGGVKLQVFAHYTPPDVQGDAAVGDARETLALMTKTLTAAGVTVARTPAELKSAVRRGRVAAILSLENGNPLPPGRLDLLEEYHAAGVRALGLCHWRPNDLCDASTDNPRWNGLSPWGETVVREMNRRGWMVDVSHLSDDSVRRILAISAAPIMASHSDCRALNDIPRNLPDDLIRAIAAKGGLVGVNFSPAFLDADYLRQDDERLARLQPQLEALEKQYGEDRRAYHRARRQLLATVPVKLPGVARLVDHIDHVVTVGGIDAVGLGSDFDGIGALPAPMESCADIPLVTCELLRRGYTERDVRKILGGNFLRFFESVTRAAAAPSTGKTKALD